jgi:hypothetical protein
MAFFFTTVGFASTSGPIPGLDEVCAVNNVSDIPIYIRDENESKLENGSVGVAVPGLDRITMTADDGSSLPIIRFWGSDYGKYIDLYGAGANGRYLQTFKNKNGIIALTTDVTLNTALDNNNETSLDARFKNGAEITIGDNSGAFNSKYTLLDESNVYLTYTSLGLPRSGGLVNNGTDGIWLIFKAGGASELRIKQPTTISTTNNQSFVNASGTLYPGQTSTVTLVAGVASITDTAVPATSTLTYAIATPGGTVAGIYKGVITAGSKVDVTAILPNGSTQTLDTSTLFYQIWHNG